MNKIKKQEIDLSKWIQIHHKRGGKISGIKGNQLTVGLTMETKRDKSVFYIVLRLGIELLHDLNWDKNNSHVDILHNPDDIFHFVAIKREGCGYKLSKPGRSDHFRYVKITYENPLHLQKYPSTVTSYEILKGNILTFRIDQKRSA